MLAIALVVGVGGVQPAAGSPPGTPGQLALTFYASGSGPYEIHTMSADGSGLRQSMVGGGLFPAWSPDGRRLAFLVLGQGIVVANADGTARSTVVAYDGGKFSTLSTPSWSPDARRLAFSHQSTGAYSDISVVNVDGTGLTQLTSSPREDDLGPDWSPDGTKLAYSTGDRNIQASIGVDIWTMNADGNGKTRLTTAPGPDTQPSWSPDGRRIAFASGRIAPGFCCVNTQIYAMNADGSGQTGLTTAPSSDSRPVWAPDGSKIAFTRYLGGIFGNGEVFVISPDGSGATQLTDRPGADQVSSWQRTVDVGITMRAPRSVKAGRTFTVTAILANSSPTTAPGAALNLLVPTSLKTVSAGTCRRGRPIACTVGTVAASGASRLTFRFRALRSGRLTLTATTSSAIVDPRPANNRTSARVTVKRG